MKLWLFEGEYKESKILKYENVLQMMSLKLDI